jgi:hypothetical protein
VTCARRPSRRAVLAAVAAAAAVRPDPALAAAAEADAAAARAMLDALFSDRRSAAAVGAGCLPAAPQARPSPAALVRAILPRPALASARCVAPSRLAAALRAQIRRDFARGEIVAIDGWLLSRTEARLYALAAITGVRLRGAFGSTLDRR